MSLIGLRSKTGSARVETRGGTMVSWEQDGFGEVLALPCESDIGRLDAEVHGGIPICWPWAVHEGPSGCRIHGIVRYREWSVVSCTDDAVVLSLDDDAATKVEWPYQFHLELTYRLTDGLDVEFKVKNTGSRSFVCTELFHPYFRVGDVCQCRVTGTDCARYFWRKEADAGDCRTWQGDFACTRFVEAVPGFVFEENGRRHVLIDPVLGRELNICYSGNSKLVIWGDRRFVCVEGGTPYRDCAYELDPGQSHGLGMSIQLSRQVCSK